MARTSDSDILVAIGETAQYSFELLDITVGTGDGSTTDTVYISNGSFDVTWGGQTYQALGHFLSVSDIDETADFQVNTVTIGLSGVPTEIINLFFQYQYLDRPIRVHRAFFNDTGLIGAITIFDGRMDKPVLQEDPKGQNVMGVECRSNWSDYERRAGRHTNHDEQQFWFAGDKGLEYASQVVQDVKWGG